MQLGVRDSSIITASQACHTKVEYEEYGATICRIYLVFKGYVGVQVSILVLQKYEYLVLAWAISEVLSSLAGEDKSNMPSLILPFILDTSKTKLERKYSADECVYGIQIGPPPTDL
ncbi:uncharacterized protein LOC111911635 isoform X1 [Lactuca sativa]|nr:uncharacterized protein LOC111911635 isoform X1 [Lactuca sativa]